MISPHLANYLTSGSTPRNDIPRYIYLKNSVVIQPNMFQCVSLTLLIYGTFRQNFDFNLISGHQKISYDRRDYESVDEKSLS